MKIEYSKWGPLHWHVALFGAWHNSKTIFGAIKALICAPFWHIYHKVKGI